MTPLVLVEEVWKTYSGGRAGANGAALKDVSFAVDQGAFVALMGPSGSGKSTLLNLVGGLDRPDRGRIVVAGHALGALGDTQLSDTRLATIGTIFQFFNLLPNLTALQNVALPLRLQGRSAAEAASGAEAALRRVGLGALTARKPHELSGGEMQRVAIARAVVHRPTLILADEPTGNLDSTTGQQVLTLLRELAREGGLTVLMATHDARGRALCDRVIEIEDGRLRQEPANGASASAT